MYLSIAYTDLHKGEMEVNVKMTIIDNFDQFSSKEFLKINVMIIFVQEYVCRYVHTVSQKLQLIRHSLNNIIGQP
jgi:hypothetical protein